MNEAGKQWLGNPEASPKELNRAASALAQSQSKDDLQSLLTGLLRPDLLANLDPDEDYINCPAQQLRIAGIFKHLIRNTSEPAHALLVALTQARTFNGSDAREELLVKALSVVRPAPPPAVQYWDAHSQPESIHLHFVIEALCRNSSEPAMALLESKLLDPDQECSYKLLWMHDPILRQRNNPELLQACQRLLSSNLALELKVALVEALVDHKPDDWYPQDHLPMPPNRSLATRKALGTLRNILVRARKELPLSESQIQIVDHVIKEIETSDEH